ncbi:MAG: DUF2062 domain-containing protein [Candidatus Dependentiae bacterium]
MIIQKVQQFGKRILQTEGSIKKRARSICLGIFIAFSPFVGLHTLMAFALCWLFSLNYPITVTVQLAINNPWTWVPVYGCGYGFGRLLSNVCHIDFAQCSPKFFSSIEPLCSTVGVSADSIWIFFIGGNVLSVLLAISMYIPIKCLFKKLEQRKTSATSS